MLEILVIDIMEEEAFVYARSGTTVLNRSAIGHFPMDTMIRFPLTERIATGIIAQKIATEYLWKIRNTTSAVRGLSLC